MKESNYIRQIDKLGRLVPPSDLRKYIDVTPGVDYVEFTLENNAIKIRKYNPSCVFCASDSDIISFKDRPVCKACLAELKNN